MRKDHAAVRAAAVAAVDDLLGGDIPLHQAFVRVAGSVAVYPHTVRDWWRAAHPEPHTSPEDEAWAEAETKVAALKRFIEGLPALDHARAARITPPPPTQLRHRPPGTGCFMLKSGEDDRPGIPFRLSFTPTEATSCVHDTNQRLGLETTP